MTHFKRGGEGAGAGGCLADTNKKSMKISLCHASHHAATAAAASASMDYAPRPPVESD